MTDDQAHAYNKRERNARRAAKRLGWSIQKSKARDPNTPGYGGFMIGDANKHAVLGSYGDGFTATLDEVEACIKSALAESATQHAAPEATA